MKKLITMICLMLFMKCVTAQQILVGKLKTTGKTENIKSISNFEEFKVCNSSDYSELYYIPGLKNITLSNGVIVDTFKIIPPYQSDYKFVYLENKGGAFGVVNHEAKVHLFNNFNEKLILEPTIRLLKCQDTITLNRNYIQNKSCSFEWTAYNYRSDLYGQAVGVKSNYEFKLNQIYDTTYIHLNVRETTTNYNMSCQYEFNSIIIPTNPRHQNTIDSICMVTASNNKFKVIWPNTNKNISYYKIYKQNKVNSKYDLVHTQPASKLSEWVDSSSSANTQIERYKLGIVDSCGVYEYISPTNHTTILLSSNLGVNGTVNLSWNPYQGFQYDNFEIWRSADGTTYNKLANVANNTFSYIDNAPPVTGFYQIRITNPNGCNPDKRGSSYVNSNIVDKTGKSVAKLENNELSSTTIYPNPTTNVINVSAISLGSLITVTDMNGKIIYVHKAEHNNIEIPLANYAQKGIYTLTIQNIDKETIFKKIVLE